MRLLTAFLVLSFLSVTAMAEGQTMKQCAEQWQRLKADGKTEGQEYKSFSAACMKKEAAVVKADDVKAEKVEKLETDKSKLEVKKSEVLESKPEATAKRDELKKEKDDKKQEAKAKVDDAKKPGAVSPQEKMKACAKEWNDLKAANKTNGKTYQEFSSECLKK